VMFACVFCLCACFQRSKPRPAKSECRQINLMQFRRVPKQKPPKNNKNASFRDPEFPLNQENQVRPFRGGYRKRAEKKHQTKKRWEKTGESRGGVWIGRSPAKIVPNFLQLSLLNHHVTGKLSGGKEKPPLPSHSQQTLYQKELGRPTSLRSEDFQVNETSPKWWFPIF